VPSSWYALQALDSSISLTYLVSLPELVAQTNMDQQSVNRLREELTKLANWISRNATAYFVSEYEVPGAQYIEKARSQ
jgi:mortality factor 4-like protein 1